MPTHRRRDIASELDARHEVQKIGLQVRLVVLGRHTVNARRAILARQAYRPPAQEVVVPTYAAWPAALTRPASSNTLPWRDALRRTTFTLDHRLEADYLRDCSGLV